MSCLLLQSYLPLGNFKVRWSTVHSLLRMPTAFNLAELAQERVFLFAGILVVSLMGSFVLWGPAPKRLRGAKLSSGKILLNIYSCLCIYFKSSVILQKAKSLDKKGLYQIFLPIFFCQSCDRLGNLRNLYLGH
jgi:hypothetical protein